ncbi:MAG TPA: sigma-70 family RNA polymerase sigma factor [Candidatus Acidoferrales bacterium]|nr:sigma-70 family RNA polymerase sigma factor [Candidatus Acidoferrales bacterium]
MGEQQRGAGSAGSFEQVVLPHLDAAYNLARWLVRNPHDAEDIVQEAYLRAFKFFGSYQGGDARAWVLKIVRNTCYSFFEKNRPAELAEEFDEKIHTADTENADAEAALLKSADSRMLGEALDKLPVNFREVIVLRELEGMSYKEIAEVTGVPMGTVMSGLARARAQLRERLLLARAKEEQRGLRK